MLADTSTCFLLSFVELKEDNSSSPSLVPIIITLILVMGALTFVVIIVIGILYSKNKKQQRTNARQELEMPQYYEEISYDSEEKRTPKTSEHYEVTRERKEHVDVESSSQLPTIVMERDVVYGVGIAQAFGEEGGEYEVVQPSETPQSELSHM